MGSWSRAGYPTTIPDGMDDIPELHTIKVRDRRIQVDYPTLVQNNVKTDTVTLDLDGEWDGLQVVINLGECGKGAELAWNGSPVTIPASLMSQIGSVPASVVGYSSDGTVRLVTAAANTAFSVVSSGCVEQSEPPEDPTSIMGQLLEAAENANEAAESADTAATSANSAATAATAAAQSANAAATSATTAASNATSAASSANSAASAANAAAQTAIDAAASATGNVLVGQTGEADVASGSGAWGAKPRRLAVYGNTRQNLWKNPSGTNNGVTVTANADGSVTLSGTATGVASPGETTYALKPNTAYTFSVDKIVQSSAVPGNGSFYIEQHKADGSVIPGGTAYVGYGEVQTVTITTKSEVSYAILGLYVTTGNAVSGTYRVMLNEGSEAEPWCPPGIHSVGELMPYERNLWVNPSGTSNGVTATSNADGSITLSGTAGNSNANIQLTSYILKPSTAYTFSVDGSVSKNIGFLVREILESSGVDHWIGNSNTNTTATFTTAAGIKSVLLDVYVASGVTASGTYRVMLNEGSEAMPWVPPGVESAVRVVTAGKNLLERLGPSLPYSTSGVTFSDNGDSGIRVVGTATNNVYLDFFDNVLKRAQVIPAGTYTASLVGKTDGIALTIGTFDDEVGGSFTNLISVGSAYPPTAAIDRPAYIRAFVFVTSGATVDAVVYPQLELGSTATAYEPPNMTTVPVDLQGNELCSLPDGTRDVLNVVAGEIEKKTAQIVLDGTETWNTGSSPFTHYSTYLPQAAAIGVELLCDSLPASTSVANGVYVASAGAGLYIREPTFCDSVESLKSWLADNPVAVAYESSAPQQIPLDAVALPPLAPTWSMWVQPNANGVPATLEVEYERDVTKAIGGLEARVAALEEAQ